MADLNFWEFWEKIACPVLVLHGESSDILRHDTVAQMACKPRVKTVSFPKQGHALSLATKEQIDLVRNWFLDNEI